MFGSKLRSWMEAVRPKRKQHKKDKQIKCNSTFSSGPNTPKCYTQNHNNKYMVILFISKNVRFKFYYTSL